MFGRKNGKKDGQSWKDEEYEGWRGLHESFMLFDKREAKLKGWILIFYLITLLSFYNIY